MSESSQNLGNLEEPVDYDFKVYPSRWLVLISFSIMSCSNAMVWNTFSPVSRLTQEYFDVSSLHVDALSFIFMGIYIIFIIPASWFISRYHLAISVIVGGGFLNGLGAWIRYVALVVPLRLEYKYYIVFIGQIIASISQCFILQIPPLISDKWFAPHERALATSVGALFNQLGIAIGFLISPLILNNHVEKLSTLLLVIALFCTSSFFILCIFFRSHPPTPPALPTKMNSYSFSTTCSRLMNRSFVSLFFAFGINVGVFYAITTLLDAIVGYYRYSSVHTGWFGFIIVTTGLFGAFIAGLILDKTQKFKELLIAFYCGTALSVVLFAILLKPGHYILTGICCGFIGFFITGILPLSLEASVEVTFPEVTEEYSSGLMMMSAQIFGIIFILGINFLVQHKFILESLILLSFASYISFLCVYIMQPEYARLEYGLSTKNSELIESLIDSSSLTKQYQYQ